MGKPSSSSRKKKLSRDSSKRKKTKSKKTLRRTDHSDDSESSSTEASSYYSSEDDYKKRKRRSKGSKKKLRKRYSSSESDDDSLRVKKKKRSKRKDGYAGKKRTRSGKSRGRDVSLSSVSSSSSSESESESGRKRQKSDKKGEDGETLDKVKTGLRSSDKTKNGFLCNDLEHDDNEAARGEVTSEKSSRRLRSVIVVPTIPDDDEIEYDCNWGSKRELDPFMVSRDNMNKEDEKDGALADEEENKNVGFDELAEGSELKGEDLESILRMRALENLKRFRGGTRIDEVESKETSSASKADKEVDISQKSLQDLNGGRESSSVSRDLAEEKVIDEQAVGMQDAQAELTSGGNVDDEECSVSLLASEAINGSEKAESKKDMNVTPNENPSSSLAETEIRVSDNPQDGGTKEGFEKKTMTVMRGGELVEVSYKVYIPKKTPALARRKIKR